MNNAGRAPAGGRARPSLNDLIKEANSEEAQKIKDEIEGVRRERSKLIAKIKEARRRMSYKEEEAVALDKLVSMNKEQDKDGEKARRFGYLKRMKNRLEFRISTEASSLSKEKEIIRKIKEINEELDGLAIAVRMERKLGLVKGDVEECRRQLAEIEPKVAEMDGKLDALYANLRAKLGIKRREEEQHMQRPARREREQKPQQSQEINLEDIAVIDKRGK